MLGGHRPLVAGEGELVLLLAADPEPLGDHLGRLAHGQQTVELGHPRVDQPPPERRVERLRRTGGEGPVGLGDHPWRPAHRL